jgi:hypothetical protein
MHEFLMASNFPTATPTIHPQKGQKKKKKRNQNHSEDEEGDFVKKKHMERL